MVPLDALKISFKFVRENPSLKSTERERERERERDLY